MTREGVAATRRKSSDTFVLWTVVLGCFAAPMVGGNLLLAGLDHQRPLPSLAVVGVTFLSAAFAVLAALVAAILLSITEGPRDAS